MKTMSGKRFRQKTTGSPAGPKRMGELQADAYRIEYGWDGIPSFGPPMLRLIDNFDPANADGDPLAHPPRDGWRKSVRDLGRWLRDS